MMARLEASEFTRASVPDSLGGVWKYEVDFDIWRNRRIAADRLKYGTAPQAVDMHGGLEFDAITHSPANPDNSIFNDSLPFSDARTIAHSVGAGRGPRASSLYADTASETYG